MPPLCKQLVKVLLSLGMAASVSRLLASFCAGCWSVDGVALNEPEKNLQLLGVGSTPLYHPIRHASDLQLLV